jgi:hypothetical protein
MLLMNESRPLAERIQPFTLSGFRGTPTQGTATILVFTRGARWRRGVVLAAKWWGLACVSVFIPVAHVMLVPGFLLYGVWQFVSGITTTDLVVAATGPCPDCGLEQALDLAGRWHVPQPVTCRGCQRGLTVADSRPES